VSWRKEDCEAQSSEKLGRVAGCSMKGRPTRRPSAPTARVYNHLHSRIHDRSYTAHIALTSLMADGEAGIERWFSVFSVGPAMCECCDVQMRSQLPSTRGEDRKSIDPAMKGPFPACRYLLAAIANGKQVPCHHVPYTVRTTGSVEQCRDLMTSDRPCDIGRSMGHSCVIR